MKAAVVGHLVSQFHRPRGPLGRLAGRIMSNRRSNVDRNLWMVGLLALEPDHRVLEIGPGPGVALAAVGSAVTDGLIVGLDHSATMLNQSGARNRDLVAAGRLTLRPGSAEDLPADLGRFDRIYCMNVWHFWDDQAAVVEALAALLAPGGRLAIGHQPRHPGAADPDGQDGPERRLRSQLNGAGLTDVTVHRMAIEPPVICLVASG